MDRSVDGGMAPALQSCNHQSTGLANREVEGNKEEDAVPHEKVNGTGYLSVHGNQVSNSETQAVANAAGDREGGKPVLIDPGELGVQTGHCILSGLKETLEEVSMPAIQHIGQGDSTGPNVVNYNGWGDCKRPHSGGILQESNNISGAHLTGKVPNKWSTSTRSDGIKLVPNLGEGENEPNGGLGVRTNGNILPGPPSPTLRSGLQVPMMSSTIGDTLTFSTASCSHSSTATCQVVADSQMIATQSNIVESDITQPMELKDSNGRTVTKISSLPSQNLDSGEVFRIDESEERRALDYTDLLSSDLSRINMSDKLANTLQEVAASLKGSGLSTNREVDTSQISTSECNTVNVEGQNPAGQPGEIRDLPLEQSSLEQEPDSSLVSQKARVEEKGRTVASSALVLNSRLHALRKSIDALRLQSIVHHVSKNIHEVSSCITLAETPDSAPPQVPESEGGNIAIHSEGHKEFWRKFFQNSIARTTKKLSESDAPSSRNQRLSKSLPESDRISVKKEITSESMISGNMTLIDMVPYVQLTRVEDMKVEQNKKQDLASRARSCSGILRKELKFIQSRCDPDLTESSSDEEIMENSVSKSFKHKSTPKSSAKTSIGNKLSKSFCKWSAERAEISRRWTWLQSRISSLELDIRQQGDLYSQMRDSKGIVELEMEYTPPDESDQAPRNNSIFPRSLDNLPPLPSASLSPSTKPAPTNSCQASLTCEDACARVKHLGLNSFRKRKLVKITPQVMASHKGFQPKTVPNDSRLMCADQKSSMADDSLTESSSFILKAALHDHSYHSVISSIHDIPLSISMRAVMKSKRKWCKKSSPHKQENKRSNAYKKQKKRRKVERSKRLFSTTSSYVDDSKRRKLGSQVSDSGRKRRDGSMDSDIDSPVIIGGFSSHPLTGSQTATPTSEITGQSQNYWKKKKTTEQAYDINNIVIPHGLNSTRIEKLAYKEIQTPSWKTLVIGPTSETVESPMENCNHDIEEDTSAAAFQRRHDHYEIIEKRKYMAFMEWSISRRGSRGSRMGNIRGPTMQDPESPTTLSYTPSPVSFVSEPFSNNTTTASLSLATSPMTSATSPTAKPGVTTRRMSFDHNGIQSSTSPSHHLQHSQRSADTSLSYSLSSPSLASWQDGLGSRHGSTDVAAPVNRTLSDGANTCKNDQASLWTWEMRSFPLSEEDLKLLEDVEYAKVMLKSCTGSPDRHLGQDVDDGSKRYPIIRQGSGDKYMTDNLRASLQDGPLIKSSAVKRRRTDSRASSLASYDDTARHSDCSNASASSAQRKQKRPSFTRSLTSRQKPGHGRGKGPLRRMNSSRSKHKYLNIRLSETDETTSDSDSDSNSSEETSESCNDAGNMVDDYADPEWECPRPRERR